MSLTCNNADDTSFTETPENLSFIFFVMLFCTIVTYFPAIVKYAEFIFISASLSASWIDFTIAFAISSSSIIFVFFFSASTKYAKHENI